MIQPPFVAMATSSAEFPDTMPAGTQAPAFTLPDVTTGKLLTLEDVAGTKGTLIVFLCAHCPYVVHVREKLVELAAEFAFQGINTVGISSNDIVAYPDDAPDKLRTMAATSGISFPMLYDETQEVARAYTAVCTPDFFLFDARRRLAYRGRLDASSPRNGQPLTGSDLREALVSVAAEETASEPWPPALGCSIKWKAE